jgi:hypothetical protein
MAQAVALFGKELTILLLHLKRDNISITEDVVKAAVANRRIGKGKR